MLNIAVKAARAAGAIINRAALDIERLQVESKGTNDFVTEVDKAAEVAIIEVILQAYPGHAILAEESGREHGAKHSDYLWIIDPLDGTTNFIHGFPVYAVSIALSFRGKVEQAVVYDPARNDLFYASKGRGAFLNDRRLRVSKRTRMQQALIGTGFPFRKGDNFKRYLKDAFFETGLSPWDVAAGSLMVTEAGGLVGNFTGEADFMHQREIVAGTPKIYGAMVQILTPYTRVIDTASVTGDKAQVPAHNDEPTPASALADALTATTAPKPAADRRSRIEAGDSDD
jgi:myo-inositol-1(or 4)-monophosphatase